MKVVVIGFFIILVIFSCGLAMRYNQDATYAQEALDKERYKRITSEENLQRSNFKISSLKAEIDRIHIKMENTTMALKRTKAINEDLKQRLDKASTIQISLDRKIMELQRIASPL